MPVSKTVRLNQSPRSIIPISCQYRLEIRQRSLILECSHAVHEEVFAVPGNPWPKGDDQKQLGAMQMENILEGIHGMSIKLFTNFLNMSSEAVEALLVEVRKDLTNRNIHFYYPM